VPEGNYLVKCKWHCTRPLRRWHQACSPSQEHKGINWFLCMSKQYIFVLEGRLSTVLHHFGCCVSQICFDTNYIRSNVVDSVKVL